MSRACSWATPLLLACAALTVATGTTLAPALPLIRDAYASVPGIEGMARLIVTLPALAIALAAPILGRVAPRIGRRRVLLGSLAVYAIAGGSGLLVAPLAAILAGRVLIGVAAAGMMTASTTIAASTLDDEARARFFAQQASVMSLAGVASIALGGSLAAWHWRAPFAVYLAAAPLALIASRVVREPRLEIAKHLPQAGSEVTSRIPIYALALVAMAFVFMVPLQIPFLLAAAGPSKAGFAIAMTSLFAALSAVVTMRRVAPPRVWLARSFIVMGFGYLLVGADGRSILVGLAIAGIGSGWLMPNVIRWLVAATNEQTRAASIGVLTSAVYAGQFVSPVLSELLGGRSIARGFAFAGASLIVLGIFQRRSWRQRPE